MRRLTFKGFLESYVMELSYMGTCSISKLVNELDNHTKLLMRKAIIEIQEKKGITNYRIQKELKLNYGNMKYFLKTGSVEKLALETVREMLNYVRNYE